MYYGIRAPFFYDEVFMFQYMIDLRYSRQGWKCTACGKRIRKGMLMGWAALKGAFPPDVVMWDSVSCKELLQRQDIFKRSTK